MQTPNNDLKEHLPATARSRSASSAGSPGKTISIPVWFVLEGEKLSLLPMRGSDTQWFMKLPQIRRFGLMREAWKRNSEPFPSLMPRW